MCAQNGYSVCAGSLWGRITLPWLTETTELFEMGIGYMQRKILRWKRLFAGVEFHSPGGARKWVLFAFLWLVSGKKWAEQEYVEIDS